MSGYIMSAQKVSKIAQTPLNGKAHSGNGSGAHGKKQEFGFVINHTILRIPDVKLYKQTGRNGTNGSGNGTAPHVFEISDAQVDLLLRDGHRFLKLAEKKRKQEKSITDQVGASSTSQVP
jgi:hypothetical protein